MAVTAVAPTEVGVQVGSFFVSSWGYDQTNVDFYKVVGLTPKGVKVQEWESKVTRSYRGGESVVPGDGPRTRMARTEDGGRALVAAPVQMKRLRTSYRTRPAFTVASYANAYLWDGKGEHQTDPMGGH